MNFQECELGFTFINSRVCVFFGKSNCHLNDLENKFKQFEFLQIQQVHSDVTVPASSVLQVADAHWTAQQNKALIIRTADCMPVFIYHSQSNIVAAIHAGWRGVENQIVLKLLKSLFQSTDSKSTLEVWIGPHILQPSFEVDGEVMEKLMNSSFNCLVTDISVPIGKKYLIDLKKIVDSQIAQSKNLNIENHYLAFDTKTNQNFHSFRRDGSNSGRNLSFISLIY